MKIAAILALLLLLCSCAAGTPSDSSSVSSFSAPAPSSEAYTKTSASDSVLTEASASDTSETVPAADSEAASTATDSSDSTAPASSDSTASGDVKTNSSEVIPATEPMWTLELPPLGDSAPWGDVDGVEFTLESGDYGTTVTETMGDVDKITRITLYPDRIEVGFDAARTLTYAGVIGASASVNLNGTQYDGVYEDYSIEDADTGEDGAEHVVTVRFDRSFDKIDNLRFTFGKLD